MATRIQIRRDVSQRWSTFNPVLADGEFAYVKDLGKLKIGNGVDAFNDLPYLPDIEAGADSSEAIAFAVALS